MEIMDTLINPCPNFPGLLAGADGRIYRATLAGLVEAAVDPDEPGRYPRVSAPTPSSRRRMVRVHTLVVDAFLPPRPFPAAIVRHLNDVKDDNRAENLAWGTASQNLRDAIANGRRAAGRRGRVLSAVRVRIIRAALAWGCSVRRTARMMRLPEQTVGDVKRGRTWAHVPAVERRERCVDPMQLTLPMAA